ncbi:Reverse transcriptase, RNA-dependent DNA polymerase [Hirsutella rhossiliensis]|uniref:Reverse transcriptase, RNA-dependent DNA polymerase n=1 Tax=Hirsutella rhossiliensis TaxID=111463 RepID=A0A9P8N0C8_9HYPO|nr:Reverse transcriptase, RNA-dependent DNA polymerase [Hirsutella rhossiliensis]KAH0963611.1 Reverse transcriptase, RNA-dependent DNA polymerase [Hirsutella rhossiliensis]
MGKKDYKGTILDGRDSFDSWKMDLEDNLLSDDLMSCVTGKATAESSDLSTPGENAADIKNVSLARMKIRQSIDQIHKNSVNHLTDPRAIYQSLVKRYATSNKARLRQLIRMLYDVSTQTNRTVQEKVDDLKRLRAQINSQDKDIILNASTETLTMEKVQSSLESKELELVDTTIKGETAQFAGRGRSAWNKGNNRSKAQDGGDDSKEEVLFGHRHKKVWRLSQTRGHRAHTIQEKDGDNGVALKSILKMPERLLHARLGHPGKHMEGKLNAVMDDLGDNSFCPSFCSSCTEAKMTRKATGRVWVYFSRDKTRITDKIKAWVVVAEAECREYGKGEKVKAMRFDRGKEFLNEAMRKVHEVRFVEFDESKYMDNEISQESQSQDRTTDQEATEAGDAGEAADGNPTDQDTADSEEELKETQSLSQIRREAVALKRAEKQRAELEWRQREEQRMAERLKKRGESGRKERAMVARTLLQPNTDLYDFDPKKLTFRQAMKGSEKDQWVGAIDEEVQNLIRRQTFSEEINEVDVHGEEVVDAKLVFDHKKDKEGRYYGIKHV